MNMDHTGGGWDSMHDKIAADFLSDDKVIRKLIKEISDYLETMVEDNLKKLVKRKDRENQIHNSTNEFFRKRNRYRATKKILQYLVRFIEDLPDGELKGELNFTHFQEFKKLILFQSALMQEPDVIIAMDREFGRMSREKKVNLWYYKGKIRSAYFKITDLIGQAEKPVPGDYHKLFEALGRISAFWFYVRGEDESLVRITDVYIFQLLIVLRNKFPMGEI
ncbi:MAG: hypothetical protein ABFR36_03685 [Acidobacteriota bacterium]